MRHFLTKPSQTARILAVRKAVLAAILRRREFIAVIGGVAARRARMAGLLREVIEEAEEKGEPDIALLRLALLEVGRYPLLVH